MSVRLAKALDRSNARKIAPVGFFDAPRRARLDRALGDAAVLERLEQQKKLTANQWRIILTTNLGDMLDFFDFFLIGARSALVSCATVL